MEYASKGVAGAGLGLGIAGTALGILNGGAMLNTMPTYNCGHAVNRDELFLTQEIANKDARIALLESEQHTEVKIADVYERIMTKVNENEKEQQRWNAQQMVNNAVMSHAIKDNADSIAVLKGLTKVVIPNESISPGWDDAT